MTTPTQIDITSNTLQKGQIREGQQLVAWDCVPDCDIDACPLGNTCTYQHKSNKCALQTEYLQSFIDMTLRTYRSISEDDMFKIGMHIIPLYSNLCRMKIVEKGLREVTYIDAKGNPKVHPVFKEIREIIKVITSLWKDMGFLKIPNPNLPNPTAFVGGREGFGDPNHYASLTQDATNKRNVIR